MELPGVLQTIKVAHFRLAYSHQMCVVAYPRGTQEMVLEAHNRAFAFIGGVPAAGHMPVSSRWGPAGSPQPGQRKIAEWAAYSVM